MLISKFFAHSGTSLVLERNWREAQHAWRLLGDGNILNGEEGGQRGVEEGTPEFRSRGEEKGAKKEISKGEYAA